MKILKSLPLLIVGALCLAPLTSAFSEEVFSADFERYQLGAVDGQEKWSAPNATEAQDAVVEEGMNSAFSQGDRALHFFRKEFGDSANYIRLSLDGIAGHASFIVEWDWMSSMSSAGISNPMVTLYDGKVPVIQFVIHHTTNMLRFYEEQGEVKEGSALAGGAAVFEAKTWYRFRLVVNSEASTYSLRVWKEGDGQPMIDVSGIRFTNPASAFTSLGFNANVPPEMPFADGYYFDNIAIKTGDR